MGYLSKRNRDRGMRGAYRDLAHIIHQRFCYNRPNRAWTRGSCPLLESIADVTGWFAYMGELDQPDKGPSAYFMTEMNRMNRADHELGG
jgi:hypothetical protein